MANSMTSRERVLTTLKFEEPDRVPFFIGAGNTTGIQMPAYQKLKTHLGIAAADNYIYDWPELGTAALDEATLQVLKSDVRAVLDLAGIGEDSIEAAYRRELDMLIKRSPTFTVPSEAPSGQPVVAFRHGGDGDGKRWALLAGSAAARRADLRDRGRPRVPRRGPLPEARLRRPGTHRRRRSARSRPPCRFAARPKVLALHFVRGRTG